MTNLTWVGGSLYIDVVCLFGGVSVGGLQPRVGQGTEKTSESPTTSFEGVAGEGK